jgi:hypothetical protein
MKKRLLFPLILALVVGAFVLGRSLVAEAQTARQPQKVVWEYKDAANLSLAAMNVLGAEGWELVGMTVYEKEIYYVFKKAK